MNHPPTQPGGVPVTIVTGGDEATALTAQMARGLAAEPDAQVVGVVTEQPAEPVPESVQWITTPAVEGERCRGCACCRVRLDVVESIRALAERPRPVGRILVRISEGDDLATAIQTVLSDPDLRRLAQLDGVLCTLDGARMSTRLALGLPFAEAHTLEALAAADRVLVSRADQLTARSLGAVVRTTRSISHYGPVLAPAIAPVHVDRLVDLHAWHGAPRIQAPALRLPVVTRPDATVPSTITCRMDRLLDPAAVDGWFDELVSTHASRLLRVQGAVAVEGQEHRVCCYGVKSFAASHSETEHAPTRRSTHSLVAVTGYGLDARALREAFRETLAR